MMFIAECMNVMSVFLEMCRENIPVLFHVSKQPVGGYVHKKMKLSFEATTKENGKKKNIDGFTYFLFIFIAYVCTYTKERQYVVFLNII